MWYAFFVFGGFWFWALVLFEFIVLSIFVQEEQPLGSFLCVLIFVALIHLFGDANFFTYIKDNPWDILRIGIIYFVLGFCWACGKFYYVSQRVANKIAQLKEEFNENISHNIERYNDDVRRNSTDPAIVWDWYMNHNLDYDDKNKLSFLHQGTQIIFWMSYWPISMFWTFFTDILRNFSKWCYETFLIKIFKKIHENTIGKATQY